MKKLLVLLISATIAISSTIVSFAGEWKQDSVGWWYQNDDGSYVKNDWLTLGDARYRFDSNGYMQTGLIEVNGIKHFFDNDGRMMFNGNTPEGYRIDFDGRVIDENTPGINFSIVWTSEENGASKLLACRFINEGKTEITVNPIVEVNTGGMIKKFYLIDLKTLTPCDYGVVPANNQKTNFAFVSEDYQQFTFNESSTLKFTVGCNSFENTYNYTIPSMKFYRFHIEE